MKLNTAFSRMTLAYILLTITIDIQAQTPDLFGSYMRGAEMAERANQRDRQMQSQPKYKEPQWLEIGNDANSIIHLDTANIYSINGTNKLREAWFHATYKTTKLMSNVEVGRMVGGNYFNCNNQSYSPVQGTFFDKNNNLIKRLNGQGNEFSTIPKGTILELVYNKVCTF